MSETNVINKPTVARPYYEALDKGCDALVRCAECRELVTHAAIVANQGTTPCCGSRRVREIRVLKQHEWDQIVSGAIDFPYRAEFLKEFAPSTVDPLQSEAAHGA